jgi:hypothetical protein
MQSKCKHTNVEIKYHSDTGNFDPSRDAYWKDCHCLECDKYWSENQ